jgi:transcriptional regulator with XRE-family HTH domain
MEPDYGLCHMGIAIDLHNRPATFPCMGTIGERVRALRKARGLTQPQLASEVGIDQSTVSDIERGKGFSAEILMRLCDALETTAEYIMRGNTHTASPNLKRAQAVVKTLTDEERIDLLTAIMQPGLPDDAVEAKIPATRAKPIAPARNSPNPSNTSTDEPASSVDEEDAESLFISGPRRKPKERKRA